MSNDLLPFYTEDGTLFHVEIDTISRPVTRGNKEKILEEKGPGRFIKSIEPLNSIVGSVMSKVREIKESPEEITLEMGIKLSAEAGVILTKASGEAHFKLTIKWQNSPKTTLQR